MRKLIIGFAALLFSQFSFGQLQDNATIPVSVTLNSILRLQVKTGGNIQFVFNTMAQYKNGIANSLGTTTTFTVASSKNYRVSMGAEDPTFMGIETGSTSVFPLNVVQYEMFSTAPAASGVKVLATQYDLVQISATPDYIVGGDVANPGHAGGEDADHQYEIRWRAGMGATKAINFPADVYVTNVFLNLQPIP